MAIQSTSPENLTRRSLEAHLNLRSQFFSMIAYSPSTPAASKIFDATHVMSSSEKLIVTVSSTSSYLSKEKNLGLPIWGIYVSGCISWRMSATGLPVCVYTSPGRRQPTPLWVINRQTAWCSFLDITLSWKHRAQTSSSPSFCATLPSIVSPTASVSPIIPICRPTFHRFSRLNILARISLAYRAPGIFIIMTYAMMRG